MKQNRPAIIGLVCVLAVALLATSYFFLSSRCTLDGKSVCYNKDDETFLIEKDANLVVQVESEQQGQYLVETWNTLHPEFVDAVSYAVEKPLSVERLTEGNPYDVMITKQNDAVYFLGQFYNMSGKLDSVVGSKIPVQLQDTINLKGYYFIQNSINGPTFAYNATLMEELGYDLKDEDKSGLPDVFETWELIMQEAPKITEKIDVVFPLTFTDQNSFYPFLTGGRWMLNFTKSGSDPGFNTREFKEGLGFIESLNTVVWDKSVAQPVEEVVDPSKPEEKPETEKPEETTPPTEEKPVVYKNTAESLPWQYETAFYERRSMFTLVQDFDFTQQYESQTQDQYVYAPFPKYQDHRMSPMAEVEGYVVDGTIKFPSAAAEAIRILRLGEGVSIFHETTGKIPVYHRTYLDELTIDNKHVMERILAYNFSDTPPVMALDKNPDVLARTLYRDVDLMPILRNLYDGTIKVDVAQQEIQKLAETWIKSHEPKEEE